MARLGLALGYFIMALGLFGFILIGLIAIFLGGVYALGDLLRRCLVRFGRRLGCARRW